MERNHFDPICSHCFVRFSLPNLAKRRVDSRPSASCDALMMTAAVLQASLPLWPLFPVA